MPAPRARARCAWAWATSNDQGRRVIASLFQRQFLLFLLASGTAALANFGSRILLGTVMPYVPSIVLAYLVGMCTAFVLNRAFVFRDARTHLRHQAFWFIAVNVAAVLQTVLVSLLLARWLLPAMGVHWHVETLAHAVGVVVPVFSSYFGHRHITFRRDARGEGRQD
jgi:putative flippase GtrA